MPLSTLDSFAMWCAKVGLKKCQQLVMDGVIATHLEVQHHSVVFVHVVILLEVDDWWPVGCDGDLNDADS
jgi:hypothetical protein